MPKRKVLIVDDDLDFCDMLAEQLRTNDEFVTEGAGTGAAAVARTGIDHFDIILLDIGLPDMDGREVCRTLRHGGVKSPILMLTGADTDADTILGLEAGANDYVTKPFRMDVLLARMRAHLREHEQSEYAVFSIGPYSFRPAAKLLLDTETNKKVRLTDKETAIIKFLYLSSERTVGRDVLLDEVWGYNAGVTTHTLETHVYRLRQKIERDPANARLLVTEPNGYRLVP